MHAIETVKDARRDFASGNDVTLPTLPPCPASPGQRKKAGRKIITADKIFGGSLGRIPKSSKFDLPQLKSSFEDPSQYDTAVEAPNSPKGQSNLNWTRLYS
jgi:hypothetical protein